MGMETAILQQKVDLHFTVYDDQDIDRFVSWDEAKQFLNSMPYLSIEQCYYLTLLITGFRPKSISQLTNASFLFSDPDNPVIINRLAKAKKRTRTDATGRTIQVRYVKVKRRVIPVWFRDYLIKYVEKQGHAFAPTPEKDIHWIFPNLQRNSFKTSNSWCTELNKRRKKLFESDPIKWAWTHEAVNEKIVMGRKVYVRRLSQYAFRKSRATWHGLEAMSRGVDPVAAINQFLAHAKYDTSWRYLRNVYDLDGHGNVTPKRAPKLSRPIVGSERQKTIDEY